MTIYKDSLWTSFLGVCRFVFCNAQKTIDLGVNVKQRIQLRGKGRALHPEPFFFSTGCARKRMRPEDFLCRKVSGNEGQEAYRDGVPMLEEQLEQRFILEVKDFVKDIYVLFDARPGRSRHRVLPAQEQSDRQ